MACLMKCAAQHPSDLAMKLLGCAKKQCLSHQLFAKKVSALPDCSTNACPALCECAEAKCTDDFSTCLGDKDCASNKACADQCACGDMACLMKCAAQHPSDLAMKLLGCAKKECLPHQPLQLFSKVSALPD